MEMYEWNQGKRQINIEKHGIDFIDAIAIFDNPMLVMEPPREDERRFLALGEMDGRVIAVIYTILYYQRGCLQADFSQGSTTL